MQIMRMAGRLAGLETSGVTKLLKSELALVPCEKHPLGKFVFAAGHVAQTVRSAHESVVAAALHSALSRMSKWPCSSQVVPWVTW